MSRSLEDLKEEMGCYVEETDLKFLDDEGLVNEIHWDNLIAIMLRVRDAALEEAARYAEQKVSFPDGDVFRYPGGAAVATGIRSLKQETSK